MSYIVTCTNCGKKYECGVNRDGICPDCKKTVQGRRNTKYRDKTYDRVTYYVPKGDKERLQAIAKHLGMSLNEYITNAINMYTDKLEKDGKLDE